MSYDRTKLKQALIRDEDLRLEAYKDTVGLWTIGVGHLLGETARMTRITNIEAMALLDSDIVNAEHVLDGWIPTWKLLDDARQRALLNFCFNLGNRVLKFVDTRGLLLAGKWHEAADAMLASKWATQVGYRAVRISDLIRTGRDPV